VTATPPPARPQAHVVSSWLTPWPTRSPPSGAAATFHHLGPGQRDGRTRPLQRGRRCAGLLLRSHSPLATGRGQPHPIPRRLRPGIRSSGTRRQAPPSARPPPGQGVGKVLRVRRVACR
jgi:hypothetical protein